MKSFNVGYNLHQNKAGKCTTFHRTNGDLCDTEQVLSNVQYVDVGSQCPDVVRDNFLFHASFATQQQQATSRSNNPPRTRKRTQLLIVGITLGHQPGVIIFFSWRWLLYWLPCATLPVGKGELTMAARVAVSRADLARMKQSVQDPVVSAYGRTRRASYGG